MFDKGGIKLDFASDCKRCEECSEATKRPVGLWDGIDEHGNDVSGCFYDCDNTDCAINQDRSRKSAEEKINQISVAEQNKSSGTSAVMLRKKRHAANCSVRTAAEIAGISVSEYCAMECGRKGIPVIIYRGLSLVFKVMESMRRGMDNGAV